MTHPPHASEDHGPDDAEPRSPSEEPDSPAGPGAAYPSPAAGRIQPYGAPQPYGQPQPHGQPQPYGQQPYVQPQPYGPAPQSGPPAYGPPQYGFPGQPYGPPPAAPAKKSKAGLIAVLTVVALVAIGAVVVLVRISQPAVLDAAAAERDVAAQFQQREGIAIDLTCPDNMKVRAGATYTCTGKTAEGESVRLRLAITDARTAAYTWTEP